MATIGYATVGSNNLERAKAFYDALLGTGGMTGMFEHPSGGRAYGKDGNICLVVLGPYNKEPATVGNGSMVGLRCDSTAEVDAIYAKAMSLGGKDEGAPGPRGPSFYISYFRDLDGNKLAAFFIG
jgi:catechol 2,3-dioxygenase-like lactoylglutathione lyase family enzyme